MPYSKNMNHRYKYTITIHARSSPPPKSVSVCPSFSQQKYNAVKYYFTKRFLLLHETKFYYYSIGVANKL